MFSLGWPLHLMYSVQSIYLCLNDTFCAVIMVALGLCFLVIRVLMNHLGELMTLMMMLTQCGALMQSVLPRYANSTPYLLNTLFNTTCHARTWGCIPKLPPYIPLKIHSLMYFCIIFSLTLDRQQLNW
jgi:hypothetical protein